MKQSAVEVQILQFHPDILFHVFEYINATDLHYSIPYVCKYFHNCIRVKNNDRTTGNDAFDTHACVKENVLWKQLYRAHTPSVEQLTDNHLFCFHKMYYHRYGINKPAFAYEQNMEDIKQELAQSIDFITKFTKRATENNSLRHLQTNMKKLESEMERISKLTSRTAGTVVVSDEPRYIPPAMPHMYDFFGHSQIVNDLSQITRDVTFTPDPLGYAGSAEFFYKHKLVLISPVNGFTATFFIDATEAGYQEEGRISFPQTSLITRSEIVLSTFNSSKTIEFDVGPASDMNAAKNALWETIEHLGFDTYLPKNATAKMKKEMIVKFWEWPIKWLLIEATMMGFYPAVAYFQLSFTA